MGLVERTARMVSDGAGVCGRCGRRRRGAAHRPARMSRQALASAVTVAEIQCRLQREAARSARPPRIVTVVARPARTVREGSSPRDGAIVTRPVSGVR